MVASLHRAPRRAPRFARRSATTLALGAALLPAACSHDGSPPPSTLYTVAARDAAAISAPAGTVLPQGLRVRVTDPAGQPVSGVTVRFRVGSGAGATMRDSVAATGADGVARGEAQLGPAAGPATFVAYVPSQEDRAATLAVTATEPPTLTAVAPASFAGGDTVMLRGSALSALADGAGVYFGAQRGTVVAMVGDTAVRVVVPQCVPSGAAAVRLTNAAGATNNVSGTSTPRATLALAVGQGAVVPASGANGCLSLPGDGARYLVVPQYASVSTSRDFTNFLLGTRAASASVATASVASASLASASTAAAGTARLAALGPRERFDAFLRQRDVEQAPIAARNRAAREDGVALGALTVGSSRTFRVITNLCKTVSGQCTLDFGDATATLRVVGEHVAVYVDNAQQPGAQFSDAELQSFGRLFDQTLYDVDVQAFGSESDIDGNGHVIVLLTPAVNGLTATADCNSGYVAGFFFSDDLASRGANSNKGEVFYTLAPDATGAKSCAHSADDVKRLAPATFIHEFQHMISFNQHALVRGGDAEVPWLNEGLSHMAEELGSRYYEGLLPDMQPSEAGRHKTNVTQLFPDSAGSFITPNLLNAYDYLANPVSSSVTTFDDYGSLEERGAAWLFLRWLADQKGDAILSRLVQTSRTSVDNVADKAGESFASLFNDFAIATYADSLPGVARAQIASRYHFAPNRNLRALFARLAQTGAVDSPFPITPAGLPTTTTVTGAMLPGTMKFYTLTTPNAGGAFSLTFSKSDASLFSADLGAQVGVVRLP